MGLLLNIAMTPLVASKEGFGGLWEAWGVTAFGPGGCKINTLYSTENSNELLERTGNGTQVKVRLKWRDIPLSIGPDYRFPPQLPRPHNGSARVHT